MLVRTVCLLSVVAFSNAAWAQRPLFPAPKPKVVATPTPAPAAKKSAAQKPARKRPPAKPADPLAAYMPSVKAAFSERWGDEITPLLKDFNPGDVNAVFKLDAEGKVTDFSIVENTSNEAFGKFCEQFVRHTHFEKPPENALADGQVEIPFTFSIY